MSPLVYNTESETLIHQTIGTLPHAILLEGVVGVGLFTLAKHIAGNDLADVIESTTIDGALDKTSKGIIRTTQIRSLYEITKGKSKQRRVYIIDEADKMNTTAQNAFLKLLEEPAVNVHFILTTHTPHKLLLTILSRVQKLHIREASDSQSHELITALGVSDQRQVQQLLFMAGGRPAEITRLTSNPAEFEKRVTYVTDARTLLQGSINDKIKIANKYASDRAGALLLITNAQSILHFSITNQPSREPILAADKLATIYDRIAGNGNVRIQLLSFVV